MMKSGETTALAKLLQLISPSLSHELARALIDVRADEETQAHYDELAEKHTNGALSPGERMELEAMVRANALLGILKAEAHLLFSPDNVA